MASRVNLNQHPHQILLILISTAKLCSNSQVVQISSSIQSHRIQSNIYLGDILGVLWGIFWVYLGDSAYHQQHILHMHGLSAEGAKAGIKKQAFHHRSYINSLTSLLFNVPYVQILPYSQIDRLFQMSHGAISSSLWSCYY